MITSVEFQRDGWLIDLGVSGVEQVNHIFELIAAAYIDDPGTSDLDDEQPVRAVQLTLGDVRLAWRLTR